MSCLKIDNDLVMKSAIESLGLDESIDGQEVVLLRTVSGREYRISDSSTIKQVKELTERQSVNAKGWLKKWLQ